MKKKLGAILLVVALAVTLGLVPAASVGASPGPGIVGLWHLDGNANDSSVNANHGTVTGATFVSGKFDEALSFDGNDDYVLVSDADSLDLTTAITLEAWIKAPSTGQTDGDAIVWKGGAYLIQYWQNRINAGVFTAGGWGGSSWLSTMSIFDDSWHHVALTYDGSYMRLYIDGGLDTTKAWTGNILTNANDLYFGCRTPTTYLFNGTIDEVRIWDVALTSTQIAESASLGDVELTKELTRIAYDDTVIEEPSIPAVPDVPIQTLVTFTMEVTVDNGSDVPLDCVVKDRLGAELELVDEVSVTEGVVPTITTSKGKSEKVFIDDWTIPSLAPLASGTLTIVANTDKNPGGGKKSHQEYTSANTVDEPYYELNSGATLKFKVTIAGEEIWLVLTTDPLLVTASGIEDEGDD